MGKRAAQYGNDWPLLYYKEFLIFSINKSKLVDLIDSRNGLLDEMLAVDCINSRQKHYIETGATDEIMYARLHNIVLQGSLATYNAFIHCLKQTKQHHVVSLLAVCARN